MVHDEPLSWLESILLALPGVRTLLVSCLHLGSRNESSRHPASYLACVSKSLYLCLLLTCEGSLHGYHVAYGGDRDIVNDAFSQHYGTNESPVVNHIPPFPPLMRYFCYCQDIIFPSALTSLANGVIVSPAVLPPGTLYLKYMDKQRRWGLFASSAIASGVYVCLYAGEHVTSREAARRYAQDYDPQRLNYVLTVKEYSGSGRVLVTNIDATNIGGIARFINHSCEANLDVVMHRNKEVMMIGDTSKDYEQQRRLLCMLLAVPVLRSVRMILPNEELCFDYGGDEVNIGKRVREDLDCSLQPSKPCYCGALNCRKYLPCSK